MTLSFVLWAIVALIVLAGIFIIAGISPYSKRGDGIKSTWRWCYVLLFCALCVCSIFTVSHYIYPEDPKIFGNSDYHVLRHKGYISDGDIYLVRNDYPYDTLPQFALWDSKTGVVRLTNSQFIVSDYYEPFYVTDRGNGPYQLLNNYLPEGITGGFEIRNNNKLIYTLKIFEKKDGGFYYVSSIDSVHWDTSKFQSRIDFGYPLLDIVEKSPNINISDVLGAYLDGAYLCRSTIGMNGKGGRISRAKNTSDLVLFPSESMSEDPGVCITYLGNGITENNTSAGIKERHFTVDYSINSRFFAGINSRPTYYQISSFGDTIRIDYSLPVMYYLNDSSEYGRMFITSNIDNAVRSELNGGYYYSQFDLDDNVNHFNGELKYKSGSSREALVFEVNDFGPDKTCIDTIHAGDEFFFSTNTTNNLRWVFDVQDLRGTCSTQMSDIVRLLLVFFFCVVLRVMLDGSNMKIGRFKIFQNSTLSLFEMAVYLVVFGFCLVRLILGWRSSTFVPVSGIGGAAFEKMRSSVVPSTYFILAIPLVAMFFSAWSTASSGDQKNKKTWLSSCEEWLRKVFDKWDSKFEKSLPKLSFSIVMLHLCFLGVCYALPHLISGTSRLCNIPIPLTLYILFDILMVRRSKDPKRDWLGRLLLIVLTSGYLFVVDAGFVIVFITFLIIHHLIIGILWDSAYVEHIRSGCGKMFNKTLHPWKNLAEWKAKWDTILCALVSIIILVAILYFQGAIMIFILNHLLWFVIAVGVAGLVFLLVYFRVHKDAVPKFSLYFCLTLYLFVFVYVALKFGGDSNKYMHMRYRAEIQKLEADEGIDKVIETCDFGSSDLVFIMRSAHNQWFINQYLHARGNDDRYFSIQPHSDQGSSFTTQTTDLVSVRYMWAEHSQWLVYALVLLLVILIFVFFIELKQGHSSRKTPDDWLTSGFCTLLAIIAFVVLLSATNKIVFIGQDFPFISLQSKVAVIFPSILLLVVIVNRIKNHKQNNNGGLDFSKKSMFPPAVMLVVMVSVFLGIPVRGGGQNEDCFDVNKVIDDITDKVELINYEFDSFQKEDPSRQDLGADSLWNSYVMANMSTYEKLNEADSVKYFSSLLAYFTNEQGRKTDPNELLHLHKRNGIWKLDVNKQHYYMPSKLKEEHFWTGDLLATQKSTEYYLRDLSRDTELADIHPDKTVPNHLNKKYPDLPNVRISQLDSTWTPDHEPLLVVASSRAVSQDAIAPYRLEWADTAIGDTVHGVLLASRVLPGDLIKVNVGRNSKVTTFRYERNADNILARNIEINGSHRLFFPLGKESLWTCQFAKLLNQVCSDSDYPQYHDSTIRLSIDYDLHKAFYREVRKQDHSKIPLTELEAVRLNNFANMTLSQMKKTNNGTGFYYSNGQVKGVGKLSKNVGSVISSVNDRLRGVPEAQVADCISNVIAEKTQRAFDFSAVVIDGDGKIRLLFDFKKNMRVDPNDERGYNRMINRLYASSSTSSERDMFGNQALMHLPSGPGSSLKPIVYTAITSEKRLSNNGWESLTVTHKGLDQAKCESKESENPTFRHYGGVDLVHSRQGLLSLDYSKSGGNSSTDYLIRSNNLYHSVVVMLGLQPRDYVEDVYQSWNGKTDASCFPVFEVNGVSKMFDPSKWFPNDQLNSRNCVLNYGLSDNYGLMAETPSRENKYHNDFGDSELMKAMFGRFSKVGGYVFPETSSANVNDRNLAPVVNYGFNQIFLGAFPFNITPLQMAVMGLRLASLNNAKDITTLLDAPRTIKYEPFEVEPAWGTSVWDAYFGFYQNHVLKQLKSVPTVGTASALAGCVKYAEAKGYHLYMKTGTLNVQGGNKADRVKNLLVIISDTELETANKDDFRKAKYYVLYLSHIKIQDYKVKLCENFIKATIDSEVFKKYMNKKD